VPEIRDGEKFYGEAYLRDPGNGSYFVLPWVCSIGKEGHLAVRGGFRVEGGKGRVSFVGVKGAKF